MVLYDAVGIVKWSGVTILFSGLVSLCQRVLVKIGALYVVTNRRVILKTGVICRRVTELVLVRCEALWITQSVTGRIFGFGTLVVTTGGASNYYCFVRKPFEFKLATNEQIG